VLTRPTYSSMIFGLFPADSMRVGCGMRGMVVEDRNNLGTLCTSRRRCGRTRPGLYSDFTRITKAGVRDIIL
jgi:hypothetical protein